MHFQVLFFLVPQLERNNFLCADFFSSSKNILVKQYYVTNSLLFEKIAKINSPKITTID
jgi:hypothetical protein